jgi:hypothetical protein
MAETNWRRQKFAKFSQLLTRSTLAFGGLTGRCRLIPGRLLFSGLEKRTKIGLMGHNRGRNARKHAKRRKKHERLASAKKKQKGKR